MPSFNFFNAPEGPNAAGAMHDAIGATLAQGEAAAAGLRSLGAYFVERQRMQEARRQFDIETALKGAMLEAENRRYEAQEKGRMDRAELRAQTAANAQAAQDARDAAKRDAEEQRSISVQRALADVDAGRGLSQYEGAGPPSYPNIEAGDLLGIRNYAQRIGEQKRKQQEAAALNQADTEIGRALSFGIGAGEMMMSEKVRGADLYPEFQGAQSAELQAAANEMFGPANPEAAKAWLKSMTSPQEIRWLDPTRFQELKQHIAGQLPQTVPGERVDEVAKRMLETGGYRMGREEAVMAQRTALEKGHSANLKRSGATGGNDEAGKRADESHKLRMLEEDPHGILRDAAEGKPRPVAQMDQTQWEWAWREAQAEAITKKDVQFIQGMQAAQKDPATFLKFQQEAAKKWLISKHAVDPNDPAFGQQAAPAQGGQAPARKGDDEPFTRGDATNLIREFRGGG